MLSAEDRMEVGSIADEIMRIRDGLTEAEPRADLAVVHMRLIALGVTPEDRPHIPTRFSSRNVDHV